MRAEIPGHLIKFYSQDLETWGKVGFGLRLRIWYLMHFSVWMTLGLIVFYKISQSIKTALVTSYVTTIVTS